METDVLGAPYQCQKLTLEDDYEGTVVATLVSRRCPSPSRLAVLHIHGFNDYFFQSHVAEAFNAAGWDFYALDLRKHGRSLLGHQSPNSCRSLDEYTPELDQAARIIRRDHGALVVLGHSTGALTAALWAAKEGRELVDGLVLNSPFFDFNESWLVRRPIAGLVSVLGKHQPGRVIPAKVSSAYGASVHKDSGGEWDYSLAWKPLASFPVNAGWTRAIRAGQRTLRRGLDLDIPVLVLCSAKSVRDARWQASNGGDLVLDVEHMVRWAPKLGDHVRLVRFDGGLHDLTLSKPEIRAKVIEEVQNWMVRYISDAPRAEEHHEAGGAPKNSAHAVADTMAP